MISATASTNTTITPVDSLSCAQSGQVTLRTCSFTSRKKSNTVVRVVSAIPFVPGEAFAGSAAANAAAGHRLLLGFLVRLVLVAPRAVLAVLQPLGGVPLVLRLVG